MNAVDMCLAIVKELIVLYPKWNARLEQVSWEPAYMFNNEAYKILRDDVQNYLRVPKSWIDVPASNDWLHLMARNVLADVLYQLYVRRTDKDGFWQPHMPRDWMKFACFGMEYQALTPDAETVAIRRKLWQFIYDTEQKQARHEITSTLEDRVALARYFDILGNDRL